MKRFLSVLLSSCLILSTTIIASAETLQPYLDGETIVDVNEEVEVEKEIPLFIYDTDLGGDIDDAFALSLLLGYERQGLIDLIGISNVTLWGRAAQAEGALCKASKVYNLPIAIPKVGGIDPDSDYINQMSEFSSGHSETLYYDTLTMYNQLFFENAQKVNILATGQLIQLDRLLTALGSEAFAQNVEKVYWVGTKYDGKRENNSFYGGTTMAGKVEDISNHFIENCPVPIVYIPADIAGKTNVGGFLDKYDSGKVDILSQAKYNFSGDPTITAFDVFAALVAMADVTGTSELYGLTYEYGNGHVTSGGGSYWVSNPLSKDCRVQYNYPVSYYNYQMNKVLAQEFTVRTGKYAEP